MEELLVFNGTVKDFWEICTSIREDMIKRFPAMDPFQILLQARDEANQIWWEVDGYETGKVFARNNPDGTANLLVWISDYYWSPAMDSWRQVKEHLEHSGRIELSGDSPLASRVMTTPQIHGNLFQVGNEVLTLLNAKKQQLDSILRENPPSEFLFDGEVEMIPVLDDAEIKIEAKVWHLDSNTQDYNYAYPFLIQVTAVSPEKTIIRFSYLAVLDRLLGPIFLEVRNHYTATTHLGKNSWQNQSKKGRRIVLQKKPPGRPRENLYDQAVQKIRQGYNYEEVYRWYCIEAGTIKPDKSFRDSFKKAMDRRLNDP